MLLLFLTHPQQIFTKEMIYEQVWGNTIAIDDNAIMVYVNRLRGKIEDDSKRPQHIVTVRGLGYRFVCAAWRGWRPWPDASPGA